MVLDQLRAGVRAGPLRPLRHIGLEVARRWPFPVPITAGGRRCYVDLRSAIGRSLYMQGDFDPAVFVPIRAALRPGDVFVDVGANIGWYSLLAADIVGPAGRVHAFEIDRRALRCLRRTVAANPDLAIDVHAVAVGERDREACFSPAAEIGHGRLVPEPTGERVPVRALDSFFAPDAGRIAVIKIDVEGAELLVLQGAARTIEHHRPLIVCELLDEHLARLDGSATAILDLLTRAGYRIERVAGAFSETIAARVDPAAAGPS